MTCFPKALFFSEWRRGGVDGWEDQEEDALIYIFMYIYLVPTYDDPAGFPSSSDNKESTCNAEDAGLIPGSERSPGEGNGNLL